MQLPLIGHALIHSLIYSPKKHLISICHDLGTVRGAYTCVINLVQIVKNREHRLHLAARENGLREMKGAPEVWGSQ